MQLTGMEQGVWNRLGVQSSDGRFTADVVGGFVNDALREFSTEEDWPWLQAEETIPTVASQSYVAPTDTGWTGTTAVTITVGTSITPLLRRTRDELDDAWPTGDTGLPQVYAIFAERLELRPIPDAVYSLTHRYVRAEKVLATGVTPYLPDAYAPVVCDLATVLCLNRSKEDARAIAAQARYEKWLRVLRDNRRRDRRPGRVRVRPGGFI